MHTDDDGITILYPYPTLYQCQQLQWRRQRQAWNRWAVFFGFGVIGWLAWLL